MSYHDSLRGPLGPPDRPMSHVVAELLAVAAVLALLATFVYAPLLATLLLGGVAGAAIALVLPRFGGRESAASSESCADSVRSGHRASPAD